MTLVFALIGGLLVAIAMQLVFANLGIALGLTVLDWAPRAQADPAHTASELEISESEDSERLDSAGPSLPITHLLGFGVAIGFSAVIFTATLLSVEFSELFEPRRGIIFGLFFWATYWLLFVWLSSTTISSIADSLLGTALEGGKQLLSTIKKAVRQKSMRPATQSGNEPLTEQSILQALVAEVSEMTAARQELPTLLAEQRESLIAEICDRTDLSTSAAETLVQELEPASTPLSASVSTPVSPALSTSASASASASALMSQLDLPSWQQILRRTLNKVDLSDWDLETIWQQLPLEPEKVRHATAQLVDSAVTILPDAISPETTSPDAVSPETVSPDAAAPGDSSPDLSAISSLDISPPEIEEIQAKLIAYCRYTNTDSLTPEKLADKVHTLREDYQLLDDESVANIPLNLLEIESTLSRRQTLKPDQQKKLIENLRLSWPTDELIQTAAGDALAESSEAASSEGTDSENTDENADLSVQAVAQKAYKTLEEEFQSIDWSQASLEDIKPEVDLLLRQLEQKGTLRSLDWSALTKRIRLPDDAKAEFTDWIKAAWSNKVESLGSAAVDSVKSSAQTRSQQLTDQITYFLHHQKKADLDPAKMTEPLTQIVSKAIAALPNPSDKLDQHVNLDSTTLSDWLDKATWDKQLWDKDAWKQALEDRKDLTTAEIQQVLDWGDRTWQPKAQQISSWLQTLRSEVSEHLQLPDLHLSDLHLSDLPLSDLPLSEQLSNLHLPDLNLPDGSKLAEARQQIVDQVVAAQEKVTERAIALKEDLQSQADAARRQVAIAAWWLFIALVSSGSAAATAGYLAAIY
ncbi:MAG: hypothetical protein WA783_04830 [Phormidesmis sp.]